MATTSTIAVARAALTDQLNTGLLDGQFHYAWPGPAAGDSQDLAWVDGVTEWTQEIPNIKAGRKQRQENYTFELVIWVARPQLGSDGAKATFERAVDLCAVIESELADDVQLGATGIQLMQATSRTVDLVPLKSGWGCQILLSIDGQARLT